MAIKPVLYSYYLNKEGTPKEVVSGVKIYVLETIILLDKVSADIERAGATIAGEKSKFLKSALKIVADIC